MPQNFSMRYQTLVCSLLFVLSLNAQLNDLMIVEYVDWDAGSGWAIKIYNPTSSAINLNNYYVKVYNGSSTTSSSANQLSGSLASNDFLIVDNARDPQASSDFQSCTSGISVNSIGVNQDDCVALTRGNSQNFVDMVGLFGQSTRITINGNSNALYENKLIRQAGNCTRYTATDGTSFNSWPGSSSANVQGWKVEPATCLSNTSVTSPYITTNAKNVALCPGDSVNIYGQWVQQPGTYRDTVPGLRSCDSIITTVVNFTPGPTVQREYLLCPGQSITLNGNAYSMDTLISFTKPSPSGCDTLITAQVRVDTVAAEFSYQYLGEDSTELRLAASAGYERYQWNTEGQFYDAVDSTQVVQYETPGIKRLRLVVTSSNGCTDTLYRQVLIPDPETEIVIPNVFTPNGDAVNSSYYIEGVAENQNFSIQIFNRYGKQVFQSSRPDFAWDGTSNGMKLPSGTYFYVIQYQGETRKGHLSLLR